MLYRRRPDGSIQVLLGHMGGPFWARKDVGAWSIPKGEAEPGEDLLGVAYREFREELGVSAPPGEPVDLGQVQQAGGKVVRAWALEGGLDVTLVSSNTFELEWPPKSGVIQRFPEIDRAEWFDLAAAADKVIGAQRALLDRLAAHVGSRSAIIDDGAPAVAPSNRPQG